MRLVILQVFLFAPGTLFRWASYVIQFLAGKNHSIKFRDIIKACRHCVKLLHYPPDILRLHSLQGKSPEKRIDSCHLYFSPLRSPRLSFQLSLSDQFPLPRQDFRLALLLQYHNFMRTPPSSRRIPGEKHFLRAYCARAAIISRHARPYIPTRE